MLAECVAAVASQIQGAAPWRRVPERGSDAGPELQRELSVWCEAHLARYKCPRSIDFERELPRLDNGKLYKHKLRDRYWVEAGAS